MALRSASSFRGPSRSLKRKTTWLDGPTAELSVSSVTPQIWNTGLLLTLDGGTLVRTRGAGLLTLNATSQVHGGAIGALGIGVCTLQAFNAGVASVPTPIAQIDWDGWLWHQAFNVASITATISDGVNAVGCTQRVEIDSKAMRKVPENMVVFGAMEIGTELGTAVVTFDATCRCLVKLP